MKALRDACYAQIVVLNMEEPLINPRNMTTEQQQALTHSRQSIGFISKGSSRARKGKLTSRCRWYKHPIQTWAYGSCICQCYTSSWLPTSSRLCIPNELEIPASTVSEWISQVFWSSAVILERQAQVERSPVRWYEGSSHPWQDCVA